MNILIADDHWLIIEAIKTKLLELADQVQFVVAMNVRELEAVDLQGLDLALVDLSIPGAQAFAHVQALRQRSPDLPVIVVSGYEDPAVMRSALDHGARGYIPKAYSPEIMLSAVRLVLAGGVYVPPMLLSGAAAEVVLAGVPAVADLPQAPEARRSNAPTLDSLRTVLTERQVEVLQLLSQGKPNKLIGRALGISEGTVKIHLAAIFRALNVRNRTEAVIAAQALTRT